MTRLFSHLESIDIRIDAAGRPVGFSWRAAWHPVETIFNRWRVETDWWADDARREYFRLSTEDGLLVEIYRDMAGGSWYLARLYD